jgi:CRP-like cAMP-binding protein
MDLLKGLPEDDILKICDALKPKSYKEGETIIQEGDESADLFFLREGTASAYKGSKEVKKYQKGSYFGERALLTSERRAASVIASVKI